VLQDVREYWTAYRDENEVVRPRYQYVYAIFSSSGYRPNAQRYAYAHDIYLIPLARSAFLQPIIAAIKDVRGFVLPPDASERHFLKKELLTPYDPITALRGANVKGGQTISGRLFPSRVADVSGS
jgi:hypothetical protein